MRAELLRLMFSAFDSNHIQMHVSVGVPPWRRCFVFVFVYHNGIIAAGGGFDCCGQYLRVAGRAYRSDSAVAKDEAGVSVEAGPESDGQPIVLHRDVDV